MPKKARYIGFIGLSSALFVVVDIIILLIISTGVYPIIQVALDNSGLNYADKKNSKDGTVASQIVIVAKSYALKRERLVHLWFQPIYKGRGRSLRATVFLGRVIVGGKVK